MAKCVRPVQGLRVSRDTNVGLAGLGGGAMTGEAKEARARTFTTVGTAVSQHFLGGCHVFVWARPGLRLGNATGFAGARPKYWPGRGQGLCQSDFVVQLGMRARGRGVEWLRPFEILLDEGFTAEARQIIRVRQDAALLFPGDETSSSRRGHRATLTNKHS